MKNKLISRFILAVIVSSMIGCVPSNRNRVCHRNQCVNVELAQSNLEHEHGLQGRDELTVNQGMLFIFPQPDTYKFWMKDMKFPIDIIWLDYAQRVVYIAPNVSPCLQEPCPMYMPPQEASYTLEINSGQAEKMGIREGARLEFHLNRY